MPNPSQVSFSDINTEVGYSSTAQTSLNDTRVRNLAVKSSGAISMANCRWGINFFGGFFDSGSYSKTYNLNSTLDGASISITGPYAEAGIKICSNGTFQCIAATSEVGTQFPKSATWLTSGINSDYKCRFDITSGSLSATSSTSGTDHALTSDRYFAVADNNGTGATISVEGTLIIKDSGGTELFRRDVSLDVTAGAPL